MNEADQLFDGFKAKIENPFYRFAFMVSKLPSAYFSGVKLVSLEKNNCAASVRYKWFSKNPFGSTYFACLAMAAEMSTGVLALGYCYNQKPSVSMLVKNIEGNFFKKATDKTIFICDDGIKLKDAVSTAISSGESQSVITKSIGKNEAGEVVAEFNITWSFKSKQA